MIYIISFKQNIVRERVNVLPVISLCICQDNKYIKLSYIVSYSSSGTHQLIHVRCLEQNGRFQTGATRGDQSQGRAPSFILTWLFDYFHLQLFCRIRRCSLFTFQLRRQLNQFKFWKTFLRETFLRLFQLRIILLWIFGDNFSKTRPLFEMNTSLWTASTSWKEFDS